MNKPFAIVFDEYANEGAMETFFEVIRSNYVAKKARKSLFIVSASKDTTSENVFTLLKSKVNDEINFVVIRMDSFYGVFPNDVIDWIKSTFPDGKYE